MKTNAAPKFMDDVVDEMGDGKGGTEYGASMDDTSEEGGDDESMNEDRIMAAKQVGKALGLGSVDPQRLADALKAFVQSCGM